MTGQQIKPFIVFQENFKNKYYRNNFSARMRESFPETVAPVKPINKYNHLKISLESIDKKYSNLRSNTDYEIGCLPMIGIFILICLIISNMEHKYSPEAIIVQSIVASLIITYLLGKNEIYWIRELKIKKLDKEEKQKTANALNKYNVTMEDYKAAIKEYDIKYTEYKKLAKDYEKKKEEVFEILSREFDIFSRNKDFFDDNWWGLSGHEFEHHVNKLFLDLGLNAFVTKGSDDKGVDIWIRDHLYEKRIPVQCKHHKKPIGPKDIRDLQGVLFSNNLGKAIFVSSSGYSTRARQQAQLSDMLLLDIDDLFLLSTNSAEEVDTLQSFVNSYFNINQDG